MSTSSKRVAALSVNAATESLHNHCGDESKDDPAFVLAESSYQRTVAKLREEKKYDASKFTNEDFKLARDSWRRDLCGDERTNDISVPGVANILLMYDLDSEQFRKDMNRGPKAPILFGDAAPTLSGDLKIQYDAIYRMALPYGTVGCKWYKSKELLDDVLYALEWMYDNMYGENVLTDTSFRSWKLYDWWDWYIGGACPMMNTLMIIEDGIDGELIKKYTTPISFLRYRMKTELIASNAMSRIMSLTSLALLTCDKELLQFLYEECVVLLEEHDSGNDMRRDYCCMTHGMAYNIGYGFVNLSRVGRILKILEPTPLAYPVEKKYRLLEMIRYTFAPSMYKGRPFAVMDGRNMQKTSHVGNLLMNFYYAYGVFGEEADREICEIMHRHNTEKNKRFLISDFDKGNVTLEEYRKINGGSGRSKYEPVTRIASYAMYYDALTNEKYDTPPHELAYMWYSGDTAVQFRHDCMIGLRMYSERCYSYECINGMNADGWYTGEGAIYLYTPEARDEYMPRWWASADKHLIPGTTVDEREREPMNFEVGYKNNQSFVGGVALDGRFITATMDHEAFHNEVEGKTEDSGHGRGFPVHISTLTSKKSYFMLDGAIACMGCDVNASDGYSVRTVVENRLLEKDDYIVINGERVEFSVGKSTREDVNYILFKRGGAYFFPSKQSVTVSFYEKEGERRCAVWLEHGVNPKSESYYYLILPNATEDEAKKYDLSDIEMIRNDSEVQAIKEKHSGLTGVVLRGALEACGIRSEQPMIAMTREECGKIVSMSVADPTQKLDSFAFTVICGADLSSNDACVSTDKYGEDITVRINCDSARGRAYTLN